ncbi:predicted protein [Histoplasma capsulatum H143]|uniref:Uncharacterized protein n=1 Tax=Ajellomyces capsulatus (strain H143) TaxID=544712 RepID=C6HQ92_AJECH|nr:predicted protein [Histoplasma capsulatum H143]
MSKVSLRRLRECSSDPPLARQGLLCSLHPQRPARPITTRSRRLGDGPDSEAPTCHTIDVGHSSKQQPQHVGLAFCILWSILRQQAKGERSVPSQTSPTSYAVQGHSPHSCSASRIGSIIDDL